MRIGILTQWYDPEPGPASLPGTLARGLQQRGHQVRVLTGFPNYPTGRLHEGYLLRPWLRETVRGVPVLRTPLYPNHSSAALPRLANYASFGASSVCGTPFLRGADVLWVNYSPITVAPAMWLARYLQRTPTVVHALDLWPDTLEASGMSRDSVVGRGILAGADAVTRAMYASAHTVAYISPGVGAVLRKRGVEAGKLAYAPMWADEALYHPAGASRRADLGVPEDAIVLLYAGSLGAAQGLEALIDAAKGAENPRLHVLIAGSGTAEDELRLRAATAPRVRFLGRVDPEEMSALLATADAAYISLNEHPHARVTMPSKTQSILAAGRPVLAVGQGDVADVITESGAGWTVPAGDLRALTAALLTLCATGREELHRRGTLAREYYDRTFSQRSGINRIEALLTAAASGAPERNPR